MADGRSGGDADLSSSEVKVETSGEAGPRGIWAQEPFATIRAHPRRFGWGIPLAFLVPIGLGLLLADWNLSAAIALQLFLQTAALLWLYVPPARARWMADRKARAEQVAQSSTSPSSIASGRGADPGESTRGGSQGD